MVATEQFKIKKVEDFDMALHQAYFHAKASTLDSLDTGFGNYLDKKYAEHTDLDFILLKIKE